MKALETYETPTGHIVVAACSNGKNVEFLSLGDYGKEANVKADFLGLPDDIAGVPHQGMLPLEDKWVVTVSTQHGCSMGCKFCDVPKVGPGINVRLGDLLGQVKKAIDLHPEVQHTKRLNLHYARMGEPTFNFDVLDATIELAHELKDSKGWGFHPVVSTMMPRLNKQLYEFLFGWMDVKNNLLNGEAGLQLSINSTSDAQRTDMFSGSCRPLVECADMMMDILGDLATKWREPRPMVVGRKIALNFALTPETIIDGAKLASLFPPDYFMCKITPMHATDATQESGMFDEGMYTAFTPYADAEAELKSAGFDVLVFVPSFEEDKGRITCGNAILSGTKPMLKEEA